MIRYWPQGRVCHEEQQSHVVYFVGRSAEKSHAGFHKRIDTYDEEDEAPTAAVSTSSLAQPQVRLLLGLRCISIAVTVDAMSTDMSVSMCPASTSSANDSVMTALMTSAMNTVEVRPSDIMSRF